MSTAAVVQLVVLALGVLLMLAAASVPLIARRARRRATIERTRKDT